MATRTVTQSGKDTEGDITALCNPVEGWSPRSKADAISDIQNGSHSYVVGSGSDQVTVQVIDDQVKGKYLRTVADSGSANNLDNLPNC